MSASISHEKIQNVNNKSLLKNILCESVRHIETNCTEGLEICFNSDQLENMKTNYIKEMKKFLTRISGGKLDERDLNTCNRETTQDQEKDKNKEISNQRETKFTNKPIDLNDAGYMKLNEMQMSTEFIDINQTNL